jgi:hypothetical protein
MFHYQNLNEKNGITGSILRNGRAWWGKFGWQWVLWSKRLGVEVGLADYGNAITANLCLILFSIYVHYDNHKLERWLSDKTKRADEKYGNGRTIGVNWFEGSINIHLWNDPMAWRAKDPWWWNMSFRPVDFLFGNPKYSSKSVGFDIRSLPMPEKAYDVHITLTEDSWKRSRWPFAKTVMRANCEIEGGIPVPGKGENSWDCGEDATYGLTTPASTFDEAISKLFASVSDTAERTGYPKG